ncbi:Transcription factor GT-2 [Handroanthus impetiginosus]|uniref:Transcription factor GT-2 n=1 Tax=Handroanthus impetiginosus TaxID=429701 RepID=A0A2G9G8H7_9LAMI|nr:Transcription factor GT-2 [Handroanthus impetiginosus]
MEREHHQTVPKQHENSSSLLSHHQNPKEILTESPRNDRLKRDEWSEGAVSSLLEAYEAKWTLRNRAKLKGQDWEDVAKYVSARANSSKSAKTQTQCKNKIESMKKRYRSESAAADGSSWPLYSRLDLLLRGNGPPPAMTAELPSVPPPSAPAEPPPAVLEKGSGAQNSRGSDGADRLGKEVGDGNNIGAKLTNDEQEKNQIADTDSSTPAVYAGKEKSNVKPQWRTKDKAILKRTREDNWDIGESIRWLAEVMVRSEQARMDTMREIERMRAEAEVKRGEMDLKRTEIIANTQLEIAKLFAKGPIG